MKSEADISDTPLPKPILVTVKQLAKGSPALSVSLIRKLLFRRQDNGLSDSGAVVNVGGRIFLNQDLFMKWIIDRSEAQKTSAGK